MVEFTGNLPQASGPSLPQTRNLAGSGADFSAIGNAVGDIFEDRAAKKADAEEASVFQSVLDEQTELTTSFLEGTSSLSPEETAGVDVFEQSSDAERAQALQNPNVRQAVNKLERIRQARNQARSPEDLEKFYLQAADVNRRIANDHPQFADVVLKASKSALGFDPLAKAIGLEQAQAVKQQDFERAQTKALVDKAVEAGVVDIAVDGSFDVDNARLKGQAIAQQEFIISQQKTQAELLESQRVPEAVLKREMFSGYVNSTAPTFKTQIADFGANILQILPELDGDPQAETKLRDAWGQRRTVFKAQQDVLIAQIEDASVQDQARQYLEARLTSYDEVFTGDFSSVANKTQQLNTLTETLKIDLIKSAPMVARMNLLSGQMAQSIISTWTQTNPEANAELTRQTVEFASSGRTEGPERELQSFVEFAEGATPLAGMSDKDKRSTIKHTMRGLNTLAENPNDVTDLELRTYATMSTQLAAVASDEVTDDKQLQSAVNALASPSKLRLFDRYATDPNSDPRTVQLLAEGITNVAQKNINTQAQLLRTEGQQTTGAIRSADLTELLEPSTFSVVYNNDTGQFEAETTGEGFITKEVRQRMASIQQSLDAVVSLQDRVGGRLTEFNEQQLRQFMVETSGFPIVGTPVALPALSQASQEGPVQQAPRTPEEMVEQLVRLGQAGDRAGIEAIIRSGGQQGSLEPTQPISGGDLPAKITTVATEIGIDASLLSRLVQAESGGDPEAVSPVGAIGLTQLMPGTAKDLGVDPTDPDQNLRGGAFFLKQQLIRFDNDTRKALAAYNWGPSRVDNAIKTYGDQWEQHIPKETENYLKRITGK